MTVGISRLPNDVLINVLKNMELLSLVCISLCSKRSKSLIKSLGKTTNDATFSLIRDRFMIQMNTGNFNWLEFRSWEPIDTASVFRQIIGRQIEQNVDIEYPNASFGKLFNHLIDIFNHKTANCFIFSQIDPVNIHSFKDAFEHVEVKRCIEYDTKYFYKFLETFPETKELMMDPLDGVVTIESPNYQKVLMRNFDYLNLGVEFPVNLSALLATNCSILDIASENLTDKDINIFIRNWIEGSNPRLEHFCLNFSQFGQGGTVCQEGIMKNIPHKKVPMDQKRTFELLTDTKRYPNRRAEINGGIDIIRKKDGTEATILIDSEKKQFQMFVWKLVMFNFK